MASPTYWLDLFTGKTWQEFLDAGGEVTGFRKRVPAVPRAVRHERALGSFETHDSERILLGVAANRNGGLHHLRIADRPLKRLLSTHRKTDHRSQALDTEFLSEESMRGLHVVADGNLREVRSRVGWRRVVRGRGESVREHIRGHDEILRRVQSLSRADEKLIAMVIARIPGRQENGVGLR